MNDEGAYKYFLSYSGVKLPLNLVSPVPATGLENRNTFFRARYDDAGRMVSCEKIVYGEVELRHDYSYRADGVLARATINIDGEATEVLFNAEGQPQRA
jgi:Family of unknown function (DUF6156)